MKIAIIAITEGGKKLAANLALKLPEAEILKGSGVTEKLTRHWSKFDGFICIMAAGIAVRAIAPLLVDKRTDPCVLVLDEKGGHVISLLSGHLGGGNELARKVAEFTGGQAVITTASDTLGLVALDVWARERNLAARNEDMTHASGLLVNKGCLRLYSEIAVNSLPTGLKLVSRPEKADVIISNKIRSGKTNLHPRNLVLGVGCNRGTPLVEFNEALSELFNDLGFSPLSIRNLASIDRKNDEKGLLAFAGQHGWSIDFFSKEEVNRLNNIETSAAALKAVGAKGVAEPCALLSAGSEQTGTADEHGSTRITEQHIGVRSYSPVIQKAKLISRKRKWRNITMAVAEASFTLSAPVRAH